MRILEPLVGVLPDCELRAVTMADVPRLTELMGRVSTAVIGRADTSEDELCDDLVGPRFDLSRDTSLVVDRTGRALVYGQAYDEHDDRALLDVFVDPDFDDDMYINVAGRAVEGALARLSEALRERSASGTIVGAGLYRGEGRMLEVYQSHGFQAATTYWRMSVDLTASVLPVVAIPDGVEIAAVDPHDDEVMSVAWRLRNDTFRDHHGNVDAVLADYAEVWRDSKKYDRQAWWLAYLAGDPVGLCLGDESRIEDDAGYIRTLGVTNSARGRGIARALLLTAFAEYADRGRTFVQLGVDTANESGATRLYESVGMKPVITFDSLELKLSSGEEPQGQWVVGKAATSAR